MDLIPTLRLATALISEGKRYEKKGFYNFAFAEYGKAHGVLLTIEYILATGAFGPQSKKEERELAAAKERLDMAVASLNNGHASLAGRAPRKDDFHDAVAHAVSEIRRLFQ